MSRPPTRRPIIRAGAWLALSLLATSVIASGDDPKVVDSSLVIVTPFEIAGVAVLDDDAPANKAFPEWVKPVLDAVDAMFAKETRRRTIVVQITLHPDRAADIAVAGRPACTEAEVEAIRKVADTAKAPRSRFVDCVIHFVLKINGGDPEEKLPPTPALILPLDRRLAEMRKAPTPAKLADLQNWARSEALPVIAEIALHVDPKYQGVRNFGKALKGVKKDGPIDVAALTDRNPDYWRAMMEMAPGVPLIPAARVALLAANGEIDGARRVARAFAPFDGHKSAYSQFLVEFDALSDLLGEDVESRIKKGIALHDAGKFDEALAAYSAVLKDYPQSAWCLYEKHHTLHVKSLKDPANPVPNWATTRKAILLADPLYTTMAEATNASELYDLILRREAESLFKDNAKTVTDLVRYADIAVDIGQPGFAAMIYWNVLSNVKPADYRNRKLVEDVLYCLDQLGVKKLKENFKGDHAAEFARIDAERAKRKRDSVAKTMQDQNE